MIWESSYWKDDLLKLRDFLRRRATESRWPERSLRGLEKRLFVAFYSIRKLIEAKKLSDQVAHQLVSLQEYPCKGKPVTLMNWDKVDVLYDLQRASKIKKALKFVCDQFIHSYVFMPMFNSRGRLRSILFASDRQRNQSLLELPLREFLRLLKSIGSDYPSDVHMVFDAKTKDYIVTST